MAAPANDDFANALLLTGNTGATSPTEIVDATTEVDEPFGANWDNPAPYKTIWFYFTTPSIGHLTVHTHASAAGDVFSGDAHEEPAPYGHLDTTLAVWQGSSVDALTEIASNDDDPTNVDYGYSSGCYNIECAGGATYYIQVGVTDTGAYNGTVVLTWVYIPMALHPVGPGPIAMANTEWLIDILDHDFTVLQTFRPESLHFVKRIRAVEDLDFEVSNSARNSDGDLVIDRIIATDQDSFKPWKHMFQLRFIDDTSEIPIMAGPIVGTNMAKGRDYVKVYGKDWMEYLNRRQIPFNPEDKTLFRFAHGTIDMDNPPAGYTYHGNTDIALIVSDILEQVMGRPNSLPITESLSEIGYSINFSINMGSTETVLSIIDGLSEYFPGFDYRVSYDREFVMWSPYRFGDPDTTADDGPFGANIAFAFGDYYNKPPKDLEYTNTGPQATHLLGLGAGTGANRLGKSLGATDIQEGFWRLDDSVSFGAEAKSQDITTMRTRKEFIFRAQEVHEIELTVDPTIVGDFWETIRPGFAIWLRQDLQLHELNSAQRIVSMDCTIDNEWNAEVKLGLNQIYNTSSHYGVAEG